MEEYDDRPTLTREGIAGLFHHWAFAQFTGDERLAELRRGFATHVKQSDKEGLYAIENSWLDALQEYEMAPRMAMEAGWVIDCCTPPMSGLEIHNPFPSHKMINGGLGFGPSALLEKEERDETHLLQLTHFRMDGEEDCLEVKHNGTVVASSADGLDEWLESDLTPIRESRVFGSDDEFNTAVRLGAALAKAA